jgi:hypothetical protein
VQPDVVVGVHAHAQPGRLLEAVRSLQAACDKGARVVLLPDSPGAAVAAPHSTGRAFIDLEQRGRAEPLGPSARHGFYRDMAGCGSGRYISFVECLTP